MNLKLSPTPSSVRVQGGADLLSEFRGNGRRAFIACTVDLISTGVDVPRLQNVVYFRYLRSPIRFQQMLGRGTRIHEESGKLHFTVYDYTDATRLLDRPLVERLARSESDTASGEGGDTDPEPLRTFEASGIEVRVEEGGAAIMMPGADGVLERLSADEYRRRVAASLVEQRIANVIEFRDRWVDPNRRTDLVSALPHGAESLGILQTAGGLDECDEYDVVAGEIFGETARRKVERAERLVAPAGVLASESGRPEGGCPCSNVPPVRFGWNRGSGVPRTLQPADHSRCWRQRGDPG